MGADRLAALRPFPIEDIVIGGQVFRIPAHAADAWLEILIPDAIDLWDVVPGLLEPDATETVTDELLMDRWSRDDLVELCHDLITLAAGRPWWVARGLIDTSTAPEVGDFVWGQLAIRGLDATTMSFALWLDAVYAILTTNMLPQQRQKFDVQLNMPPPSARKKIDRRAQMRNIQSVMDSG